VASVCPYCGNGLPSDTDDGQLIVCLGCAAHLRRRGDAVPSPVEREDTDRAVFTTHAAPAHAEPARTVDAPAPARDDPDALPPPPHSPEANAPTAPTTADDDRTPAVGVPLAPRWSPPAIAAPSPPRPASPLQASPPIAAPPPPPSRRGVTIIITAVVALLAAIIAVVLSRP
jgi:hypothetical protein